MAGAHVVGDSDLTGRPVDVDEATHELDDLGARPDGTADGPGPRPMSFDLVGLAVLMAAVTYPSRAIPLLAPGIERLPPRALLYLRLVGPAVLASLAAAGALVAGRCRTARASSTSGSRRSGVARCASRSSCWRRNLLLGLVVGVGFVAVARALGFGLHR